MALGLGTTGATILGVLLAIAGTLFLTGASLGAILRRSGHAVRSAHSRVERDWPVRRPRAWIVFRATIAPRCRRSTSSTTTRTSISDSISGPAPMLYNAEPDEPATAETHESQETLFDLPTVDRRLQAPGPVAAAAARSRASARAARRPSASPRRS